MLLSQLLDGVDTIDFNSGTDTEVSGVAYNSQNVREGDLFVCIRGFAADGHKFAPDAAARGARVIVAEPDAELGDTGNALIVRIQNTRRALAVIGANFYGRPAEKLKIIGVTGTNGKTTVTTLIKNALEFAGEKVGLIGTNANMIGQTELPAERTTPESLELHALFAKMLEAGVEYVVMEVSSHSLELYRVYGIEFEIGVFTNFTQDHLDFHKTMEHYLAAKKKLFRQSKIGVVNFDDEGGRSVYEEALCPMTTYSISSGADFRAENIRISARGVVFGLACGEKTYEARLGIPGRFSVYNALAALSACVKLGMDIQTAIDALTVAKGVRGRAETVYTGTGYTVIIDYAHTPDGLKNIINTVREFTEGQIITLFGCGGDRDKTKRPLMGELAGRLSDYCVITSDNPRTEDPMEIIREIEEGMKRTQCEYMVIENRKEAIRFALVHAKKGDCIILAGKGHETYQIIGKEKRHFDEREVVKEILEGK